MADLFSFERIAAQNGWSMAGLGIIIDITGLAVLSLIISQVPKVVALIEKVKAVFSKNGLDPDPEAKPKAETVSPDPGFDLFRSDLNTLADLYKKHTDELGETFLLPELYRLCEKKSLPHPHLTIKSLREAGLLQPMGEGAFAWYTGS